MSLRRTCDVCGGTRRKAFWTSETREGVIARCLDCGENFNGRDVLLPLDWAQRSALGLQLEVNPGPEGAKA